MVTMTFSASKRILTSAFAVIAFVLVPARAAHADNFSYVFTGTASGEFDGSAYSNTAFTVTFLENTSALTGSGGYSEYSDVDATLSALGSSFTLTGVTLEVNGNSTFQNVDFYDSTFTNGLGLSDVTPVGYNLTTNLTVPVTSSGLTPTFGGGTFSDTGGDTLQFTGDTNLGFTATDLSPTPEPSSFLLLGTGGFSVLGLLRRRFAA
jgi:PEP-CTERM motif